MKSQIIFSIFDNYSQNLRFSKGMTRVGRRLIEDFLLPALNDQRYGERLSWADKEKQIFSIRWSHKNAAKWSLDDTLVFQDWDKMKGHYHPEIKGYYMQSKQRFRAALYKLNTVKKLRTEDKHTKLYQLVLENDKFKNSDCPGKVRIKTEPNDQHIRPSVICWNVNSIKKEPNLYKRLSVDRFANILPQSPSSIDSDNSSNPIEKYSSITEFPSQDSECLSPLKMELDSPTVKIENIHCLPTSVKIPSDSNSSFHLYEKHKDSKCVVNEMEYTLCHETKNIIKQPEHNALCNPSVTMMPTIDYKFSSDNIHQINSSIPNVLPNRHLPICPIPLYSKTSVQTLQPRKIPDLPVDLSVKRDRNNFENSNIPLSAR